VAGTSTVLGSYSETLTALSTYALKLDMDGSTIRLLVNGVERVSATDTAITSAGRGGVRLGYASASGAADTPSDTTGLHVDNLTLSVPTPPALADSKGSNTGTYLNGVTLDTPGALAGDANTAALLDGTNDYASVPDSASTDVADGPLTLEGWVKRSNAVTTSMCIIDKGVGAAQFCFDANNLVLLRNGVAYITRSTSTTTDTSWHHVVATKSGATSVVYLDGVNVTGTVTNSTLVSTTTALLFGVVNPSSAGGYLAGAIDEFAFYNTALSAATVLDHYKAGAGTG
jgi:hypothetical protein